MKLIKLKLMNLVKLALATVSTDKGTLEYDGTGELKVDMEVYVRNEDGDIVTAPDGEYKLSDDKVAVVVAGIVTEIREPEAGSETVVVNEELEEEVVIPTESDYVPRADFQALVEIVSALTDEVAELRGSQSATSDKIDTLEAEFSAVVRKPAAKPIENDPTGGNSVKKPTMPASAVEFLSQAKKN